MKYTFILILSLIISGSIFGQNNPAQKVVDRCIKKHGGKRYHNAHIAYDFRKYHYVFHYDHGKFRYERLLSEDGLHDILTNDGFQRFINDREVKLTVEDEKKYARSVNSVHYFAFLPFFLNDNAVNKSLLGETEINNQTYYKVRVTFDKQGGGEDYDDVYIYWINKEDYSLDYLAYSFHVDGGGVRFRSAYNQRKVGGILFQDYINFKHDKDTPVESLDILYEKGELEELSRIELQNIVEIRK